MVYGDAKNAAERGYMGNALDNYLNGNLYYESEIRGILKEIESLAKPLWGDENLKWKITTKKYGEWNRDPDPGDDDFDVYIYKIDYEFFLGTNGRFYVREKTEEIEEYLRKEDYTNEKTEVFECDLNQIAMEMDFDVYLYYNVGSIEKSSDTLRAANSIPDSPDSRLNCKYENSGMGLYDYLRKLLESIKAEAEKQKQEKEEAARRLLESFRKAQDDYCNNMSGILEQYVGELKEKSIQQQKRRVELQTELDSYRNELQNLGFFARKRKNELSYYIGKDEQELEMIPTTSQMVDEYRMKIVKDNDDRLRVIEDLKNQIIQSTGNEVSIDSNVHNVSEQVLSVVSTLSL